MLGFQELIILLFYIIPTVLCIVALVQIVKSDFQDSTNKIVWLLIAILLPMIGPVLYFLIGRKQRSSYL